MPRKYPYDTSVGALLRPAENAKFFEQWTPEDAKNPDLLCAEMSRLAYADEGRVNEALGRIGFTMVGGFENRERNTQGFVASHAGLGLTVLAFRGTAEFQDLITDFNTVQENAPADLPAGGRVHTGFLKA